jgi:hypothetical protein
VYVVYRLSLTARAVTADRRGDREQADALRAKGGLLFLGATGSLMALILIGVAVLVASR